VRIPRALAKRLGKGGALPRCPAGRGLRILRGVAPGVRAKGGPRARPMAGGGTIVSRPISTFAVLLLVPLLSGCILVMGSSRRHIEDALPGFHSEEPAPPVAAGAPHEPRGPAAPGGERRVVGASGTVGPFSDGILSGRFLFLSGRIAIDPDTGEMVRGDIRRSTRLVLEGIGRVLGEAGLGYADVVKVTVFLRNMRDYDAMNEVYAGFFPDPPPARSCVEVTRLARDADLEVEAIAARRTGDL